MITLLITLLAILAIGFIWGGFIALVITAIAAIVGYFTSIYATLTIVLVVAIGSGIQLYRRKFKHSK